MEVVQSTSSSDSKDNPDNVLASSGVMGSVSVALHPLVIMNISEHYTRIRAQNGKPNPQGECVEVYLCTCMSDVYIISVPPEIAVLLGL